MKQLIKTIDNYLKVQEKKDRISLSVNLSNDLNEIMDFIKESNDREKAISMFNEEIQKEIQKLIEGGIL